MNVLPLLLALAPCTEEPEVLELSGLELLLDPRLVASMEGLRLVQHEPRPAETALVFDRPWEGILCGYVTVLIDPQYPEAPYRLYYRGRPTTSRRDGTEEAREVSCLAHSADGIHWSRPQLGAAFPVAGAGDDREPSDDHELADAPPDTNIVLHGPPGITHNFSPFLDTRPGCPPDQRYKAVGGIASTGLHAYVSADGLRWRKAQDEPILREGALDSQNIVFHSAAEGRYLCFLRTFRDGIRWISRSSSEDFLHWTPLEELDFGDAPREHLYTNQIQPYFRAPELLIGTAARFFPGRRGITPENARRIGLDDPRNYAGLARGVSDAVLLVGRQGTRFQRPFLEAFVRPGPRLGNWVARANYPALGIVPTGPGEMSMYVQRCYGQQDHHLQRLVMRTDGFVSLSAPYAGGEWTSRPFRFATGDGADEASLRPVDERELAVVLRHDLPGGSMLHFRRAASFEIPDSAELGESFSLSARVARVPAGHRRLFSSYDGGSTAPGELVFDFDSDGDLGEGSALRFLYDGHALRVSREQLAPWVDDDRPHTLAVHFERGAVSLSFDGKVLARTRFPRTAVSLRLGGLRFGEDHPPTSQDNEPFLGLVDEILVSRPGRAPQDGASWSLPVTEEDRVERVRDHGGASRDLRLPRPVDAARHRLWINASTSAGGGLRFELQDEEGRVIPGFGMDDCEEWIGDEVAGFVRWRGGAELSSLAGRVLRMRVWMKDADLYSLRFGGAPE